MIAIIPDHSFEFMIMCQTCMHAGIIAWVGSGIDLLCTQDQEWPNAAPDQFLMAPDIFVLCMTLCILAISTTG